MGTEGRHTPFLYKQSANHSSHEQKLIPELSVLLTVSSYISRLGLSTSSNLWPSKTNSRWEWDTLLSYLIWVCGFIWYVLTSSQIPVTMRHKHGEKTDGEHSSSRKRFHYNFRNFNSNNSNLCLLEAARKTFPNVYIGFSKLCQSVYNFQRASSIARLFHCNLGCLF